MLSRRRGPSGRFSFQTRRPPIKGQEPRKELGAQRCSQRHRFLAICKQEKTCDMKDGLNSGREVLLVAAELMRREGGCLAFPTKPVLQSHAHNKRLHLRGWGARGLSGEATLCPGNIVKSDDSHLFSSEPRPRLGRVTDVKLSFQGLSRKCRFNRSVDCSWENNGLNITDVFHVRFFGIQRPSLFH